MSSSSYNYEKALSIDWNGELFILTIRNETSLNTDYLYSYDGNIWKTVNDLSNSNILINKNPYNVKWTGSNFAMLGNITSSITPQGNTILRSTDGISFNPLSIQSNIPPLYDLEANLEFPHTISFPKNMSLALGGSNTDTIKIAYSYDEGKTWSPSTNSASVFSIKANNAHWNGKIWVAVGKGGNTIATSTDGIQWIGRGSYIFSENANCILWSREQTQWVAGGYGLNSIAYSADGIYWFGINNPVLFETNDIIWNGSIWVATGVPLSNGNNKSIAYSYNGIDWSTPEQSDLFDITGKKISWNNSFWTIIGSSTSLNQSYNIATSTDGIHWKMSFYSTLNDTKNIFYSPDTFTTFFLKDNSVSFTKYNDLSQLESVSLSSKVQSSLAFLYNGSQFLIGGNAIITSTDGTSWSTPYNINNMSQIQNFAWNHPYLGTPHIKPLTIALGEGNNTIAYSEDGIFWKGLGKHIFTIRGNNAVWNGTLWVAVGSGIFWVATSYDGIHWLGRDNILMSEGYDVAWNGTVFVAVGSGGSYNMAVSADGIVWYGIPYANEIFSLRASAITWTGKIWLAYGSGINTTAYSLEKDAWIWQPTNPGNLVIRESEFLNRYLKPIVTKTNILYQQKTNTQNTYQVADLYGNIIENSQVNNIYYTNNILYGGLITSNCFDGQSHIVTSLNGNISYISNNSLNTNLNFDISINGITFQQNITGNIYSSCFNGKRIILGGTGGNVITYSSPINDSNDAKFYKSLNANNLFSSVYGVASNSGYGALFIPNRIYFNPGDKLSIIGPKSYNPQISKNTISMNLYNSNIVQNIQLPSVTVIIGLLGPKGPTGSGYQGPDGIFGVRGLMGPTGYMGESPYGCQGEPGLTGEKGNKGSTGFQGETGIMGFQGETGILGPVGPTGYIGSTGITGQTGPIGKKLWNIEEVDNKVSITTNGNLMIGTIESNGILDISGIFNINGNISITKGLTIDSNTSINSIILGKTLASPLSSSTPLSLQNNTTSTTVVDISGNVLSNKMSIGNSSSSFPSYEMSINGNTFVKKININKLFKNIREPDFVDYQNITIDYQKSDVFFLDINTRITNNYNCNITNLPITTLSNGVFTLSIINDYTNSTLNRYYCNTIDINGNSYVPLFNGGNPSSIISYTSITTKYIQQFSIICLNSTIIKITCNTSCYNT